MEWWHDFCAKDRMNADEIIGKWPQHLQSGTIFITENSANNFMQVAVAATVLMWSLWFGCDPVFKAIGLKSYTDLEKKARHIVVRDIVHMSHHLICTFNCFRVIIFACSDGDGFPPLETDWNYFRFFLVQECRYRPVELHMYSIIVTTAYIIWDTCRLLLFEEKLERLDK